MSKLVNSDAHPRPTTHDVAARGYLGALGVLLRDQGADLLRRRRRDLLDRVPAIGHGFSHSRQVPLLANPVAFVIVMRY